MFVFDPAIAVAERAEELFWPQEVGDGITRFIISKDSDEFRAFVIKLFPEGEHVIEVLK